MTFIFPSVTGRMDLIKNRALANNSSSNFYRRLEPNASFNKRIRLNLAKTCKPPEEIETGKIVGGFAHNQVLALADKVVNAV